MQTLGQANHHRSNGEGGKSLGRLLEKTVDKSYGPVASRLLLSLVRFARIPEARPDELLPLPSNISELATKVWDEAQELTNCAPSHAWQDDSSQQQRRPVTGTDGGGGGSLEREVKGPFRRWLSEKPQEWSSLRTSIDRAFCGLWMRSLPLESRPVDCPINR